MIVDAVHDILQVYFNKAIRANAAYENAETPIRVS